MSILTETADIPELCDRLLRDAHALAVMILGQEGEILGHAGSPGALEESVVDAIADATASTLTRASQPERPDKPEPTESDEHYAQMGDVSICAAPVGKTAVLVVAFNRLSSLGLVRLRMSRTRELILRCLDLG